MSGIWIDEKVENYFAASPIGPFLEVGHVAQSADHPLHYLINKSLELISNENIAQTLADKRFCGQYGSVEQEEKKCLAREWILIEELRRRILKRKRNYLLDQCLRSRPVPYEDPQLADLEVSADKLVPMSGFDVEEGVLLRNNRAYLILPPTPSENSSYWITRALLDGGFKGRAWVRLDPLIRGRAQKFSRMSFKVRLWGPPLLWKNVGNIKKESFGRWVPSLLGYKSEFTDYALVPRVEGIHMYLEEMPKRDDIHIAGSRYFHVIFSKEKKCVVHLDGAIRVYTEAEWDNRRNTHVHRTGKVGKRIKIYRIDGPIMTDLVSSLAIAFFVWNYDVYHFFGKSVPSSLLGE